MRQMYEPGQMVMGSWKIVKAIGQGSFGQVFEISRTEFGMDYRAALKVITIPANDSEIKMALEEGMTVTDAKQYFYTLVEEIVKEFSIMFQIKGMTNIVSYEDHAVVPHENGIGWDILIRMELLTPLLTHAYQHPFSRRDVIQLGIDMCKALELCQKYNIIHRDLKPDNIFVSANGDFKLGDFGIARTIEKTSGGLSKKGTYHYMAPEVYRGEEYGFSVDTYSLGIVLYRLLNKNRVPFMPDAPQPITYASKERALAQRMGGVAVNRPFYGDGRLAEIVCKACAFTPKERYSTPLQMRQELESIQYRAHDSAIIYPSGDEVSIEENLYMTTGGTQGAPKVMPQPDATEFLFEHQTASAIDEKTELIQNPPPAQPVTPPIPQTPVTPKNKTKKPWLIPVASICGVLLVAAIGFGIYQGTQKDEPTATVSATQAVSEPADAKKEPGMETVAEPVVEQTTEATTTASRAQETTSTDDPNKITWNDETMASLIAMALDKNVEDITQEDLNNLTSLYIYGVADASTTRLTMDYQDAKRGNLFDISDLGKIKNLEILYIQNNSIVDISPMENLTNLTELSLSNNNIDDITTLSTLTGLTVLGIGSNKIADLSPLYTLTELTILSARDNAIVDISPLSELTNLQALDLPTNRINDISPVENLTNLIILNLSSNPIESLVPLKNLSYLDTLSLDDTEIWILSGIENLSNLTSLSLNNTCIMRIDSTNEISYLTNLTTLSLNNTFLSDISGLAGLPNLVEVSLEDNIFLDDWSPVNHVATVYGRPD